MVVNDCCKAVEEGAEQAGDDDSEGVGHEVGHLAAAPPAGEVGLADLNDAAYEHGQQEAAEEEQVGSEGSVPAEGVEVVVEPEAGGEAEVHDGVGPLVDAGHPGYGHLRGAEEGEVAHCCKAQQGDQEGGIVFHWCKDGETGLTGFARNDKL